MKDRIKEIEEAIKIVGPVAKLVGLTEDDTKIMIGYIDRMSERGVSGAAAGVALRIWLKNEKMSRFSRLKS